MCEPLLGSGTCAVNQLVLISSPAAPAPALVAADGERASMRFLEFFAANIRNPHTRRAYAPQACGRADRNMALEYQSGERKAHP
jgi:hypothetical protein